MCQCLLNNILISFFLLTFQFLSGTKLHFHVGTSKGEWNSATTNVKKTGIDIEAQSPHALLISCHLLVLLGRGIIFNLLKLQPRSEHKRIYRIPYRYKLSEPKSHQLVIDLLPKALFSESVKLV